MKPYQKGIQLNLSPYINYTSHPKTIFPNFCAENINCHIIPFGFLANVPFSKEIQNIIPDIENIITFYIWEFQGNWYFLFVWYNKIQVWEAKDLFFENAENILTQIGLADNYPCIFHFLDRIVIIGFKINTAGRGNIVFIPLDAHRVFWNEEISAFLGYPYRDRIVLAKIEGTNCFVIWGRPFKYDEFHPDDYVAIALSVDEVVTRILEVSGYIFIFTNFRIYRIDGIPPARIVKISDFGCPSGCAIAYGGIIIFLDKNGDFYKYDLQGEKLENISLPIMGIREELKFYPYLNFKYTLDPNFPELIEFQNDNQTGYPTGQIYNKKIYPNFSLIDERRIKIIADYGNEQLNTYTDAILNRILKETRPKYTIEGKEYYQIYSFEFAIGKRNWINNPGSGITEIPFALPSYNFPNPQLFLLDQFEIKGSYNSEGYFRIIFEIFDEDGNKKLLIYSNEYSQIISNSYTSLIFNYENINEFFCDDLEIPKPPDNTKLPFPIANFLTSLGRVRIRLSIVYTNAHIVDNNFQTNFRFKLADNIVGEEKHYSTILKHEFLATSYLDKHPLLKLKGYYYPQIKIRPNYTGIVFSLFQGEKVGKLFINYAFTDQLGFETLKNHPEYRYENTILDFELKNGYGSSLIRDNVCSQEIHSYYKEVSEDIVFYKNDILIKINQLSFQGLYGGITQYFPVFLTPIELLKFFAYSYDTSEFFANEFGFFFIKKDSDWILYYDGNGFLKIRPSEFTNFKIKKAFYIDKHIVLTSEISDVYKIKYVSFENKIGFSSQKGYYRTGIISPKNLQELDMPIILKGFGIELRPLNVFDDFYLDIRFWAEGGTQPLYQEIISNKQRVKRSLNLKNFDRDFYIEFYFKNCCILNFELYYVPKIKFDVDKS
jgi:hypothetical protein